MDVNIILIQLFLLHQIESETMLDSRFSRIRTLSDSKIPKCVLNEPIRVYITANKLVCFTRCSRNPSCTGVSVWYSTDIICKEIGQTPYIQTVAPMLCSFYVLRNFTDERSNDTSKSSQVNFTQIISGLSANVPPMAVQIINNWLVILQRINGDQSFDQNYREYRRGFGGAEGSYWLGLMRINIITSYSTYKLRIEVKFTDNKWVSDEYDLFRIGSEVTNFRFHADNYVGDNGDVLNDFQVVGKTFKVKDSLSRISMDEEGKNCAITSGWWFSNNCNNGIDLNAPYSTRLQYFDYATSKFKPASIVRMMITPRAI